jgi:hypothetical protein
MAAAQAPHTYMASEPAFYGEGATVGLSAQEFVARLTTLKQQSGWNDALAISTAKSFMHGQAKRWVNALSLSHWGVDVTTWDTFVGQFKLTYFPHTSTTDVSADWSHLKQHQGESASAFAVRVAEALNAHREVFPRVDLTADRINTFLGTIPLHGDWSDAQLVTARAAARTAFNALWDEASTRIHASFAFKVLAAGLHIHKLQELVRAEERKGSSWWELQNTLRETERNMARAPRQGDDAKPNGNGRSNGNGNGKKSHSVRAADEAEEADAGDNEANAAARAKKPTKATGAKKKDGKKDKKFVPQCRYCPKGTLHWHRDCPNPKAQEDQRNRANAAEEADDYSANACTAHPNC